jgi:hypothetical protein
MGILLSFLPDEAIPLLFVGTGIAMTIGLVSRGAAFGFLGMLILWLLLSPFIPAVMDLLPRWVLGLLLLVVGISVMRAVSALFIGQHASNVMTGNLAADVVRFLFRVVFFFPVLIIRTLGRLVSGGINHQR